MLHQNALTFGRPTRPWTPLPSTAVFSKELAAKQASSETNLGVSSFAVRLDVFWRRAKRRLGGPELECSWASQRGRPVALLSFITHVSTPKRGPPWMES